MIDLKPLHDDWKDCTRCPLGHNARHHVLWEHIVISKDGIKIPAIQHLSPENVHVMIVGEGPGVGEDVLGRPFIGPAGVCLRKCLVDAYSGAQPWRVTLTNCVACRPWNISPRRTENRAPSDPEVEACAPRLVSLIQMERPKIVVAAGNVPDQYLLHIMRSSQHSCKYFKIRHPSWVVRQHDKELSMKYYVSSIKEVFNALR